MGENDLVEQGDVEQGNVITTLTMGTNIEATYLSDERASLRRETKGSRRGHTRKGL